MSTEISTNLRDFPIEPSHESKNPLEIFEKQYTKSQIMVLNSMLPKGYTLQLQSQKRDSTSRPRKSSIVHDKSAMSVSSLQDDESVGSAGRKSSRNRKQAMRFYPEYEAPTTSSKSFKLNSENSQKCFVILQRLKAHDSSEPFLYPVDAVGLGLDDYYDIIKEPIDLSTVEARLKNGEYSNVNQFAKDVRKIWSNAFKYNEKGSGIYYLTQDMSQYFERLLRDIDNMNYDEHIRSLEEKVESLTKQIKNINHPSSGSKGHSSTKRPAKPSVSSSKPLSPQEKKTLGQNIRHLSPDHLRGVWEIVSKVLPQQGNKEELEFDIDMLPPKVARDLEKYVNAKMVGKKKVKVDMSNDVASKFEEAKMTPQYLEDMLPSDSKAPTVDERKGGEDDDEFNSSESSFLSGNDNH